MPVVIIGSGPAGMTAACLLADQGHQVNLVDRDPGPVVGRPWSRTGVMQFHLPHGFRFQARRILQDRLPAVYAAVLAAGAEIDPGAPEDAAMLRVRRSVFERAFWDATSDHPGVRRLTGHVDAVEVEGGRAVGVVVDSVFVGADLVVDASGRSGRVSTAHRPVGLRVDTGMAYAAREYRLLEGQAPGPLNGGPGYVAQHLGFQVMVFRHEAGVFTVLFVRPSGDRTLAQLRHPEVFEAACRAVPGLAEWTDPARSEPIDTVRAGAGLTNEFQPQPTSVAGLVAIGDAFCTTNPTGARGVVLGLQSAVVLADLMDTAPGRIAEGLAEWGRSRLMPWFDDHVAWDVALRAGWAGEPVDPEGVIGLEVLVQAAREHHPEWMPRLMEFFAMTVLPEALEPLRAEVRSLVRAGWQPTPPTGPSGAELAQRIRPVMAA